MDTENIKDSESAASDGVSVDSGDELRFYFVEAGAKESERKVDLEILKRKRILLDNRIRVLEAKKAKQIKRTVNHCKYLLGEGVLRAQDEKLFDLLVSLLDETDQDRIARIRERVGFEALWID